MLCCGRSSQAAAAAAAADGGEKKKKKKSKDADYLVPVGRSVRTAALHLRRAGLPALPCPAANRAGHVGVTPAVT